MEFRTKVDIEEPSWRVDIADRLLFVGSCFADNIGKRFAEEQFAATINPYGVMYNPVSVLHTVERLAEKGESYDVAFLTFGTNHIYILKETGEVVDNCQKRPQRLFDEQQLSVEECAGYMQQTIEVLRRMNPAVRVVLTVSPIRYAKYGYHGSQLSKATLLLATEEVCGRAAKYGETAAAKYGETAAATYGGTYYFPSYEVVVDELRDYRFYNEDMLHPSQQAVEYLWERIGESLLTERTLQYLEEYRPIKQALNHRPFNAESEEYKAFRQQTIEKLQHLNNKYKIQQNK
jgi:lysophospholipase L1-like esterase